MNSRSTLLPREALYKACNPDDFAFDTTAELQGPDVAPGQERALEALRFGIGIQGNGYNLFALGPNGTGKSTAVHNYVSGIAAKRAPADDWCYVNNFSEPQKPRALRLPTGYGIRLRQDMTHLTDEIRSVIPAAFESEEYRTRMEEIEEELSDRQAEPLNSLRDEAKEQGVMLLKTPSGFAFAPMDENNEVLSPDQFKEMSEEKQKSVQEVIKGLQDKLKQTLGRFPTMQNETRDKINELDSEIAHHAIDHLFDVLKETYRDLPGVISYLDDVENDIMQNIQNFRSSSDENTMFSFGGRSHEEILARYQVNLFIDNSKSESAPVVVENIPSHANLIGRCEYRSQMGALLTDFTLIKPGALHRANGGYLILDARKILLQPYAWESLKRVLEGGVIRIESLERTLSLISTSALEPEPIPIDLKLVLTGDRLLYYLLDYYDPDFPALFKVAVDFDDSMPRNDGNNMLYAQLIAGLARENDLGDLDKSAVMSIIEHCARMAGDAEKLSTHMRSVTDLLCEANYWAGEEDRAIITAADVKQAVDKQIYRSDRLRERLNEEIKRGTLLIDTAGKAVGQVNGLSVIDMGNFAFGRPSRITVTTCLGEGEVVDIERETDLGGPIHSKGVFILSGFLTSRYAIGHPVSMDASVVFEQSYGEVEGDSASLAELCALLSSLAGIPIRQNLAMTGSVNQLGQVQPIGGVNEKIEGFFDVCMLAGLSGEQGVMIPATNIKHLMLRPDVVKEAGDGRFHIHAVETVDEAMELLTGVPAGVRDEQGNFPDDSVNGRVERRLLEFATARQKFAHGGAHDEENRDDEQ